MARGDLTLFEEFAANLGAENFAFASDAINVALFDTSRTFTAADASPAYSSANEVTGVGSSYTAGGATIASTTYIEASGVATLAGANVTWSQDASGFTGAVSALIYDADQASDMAIGWVDLGSAVSQQDGDVTISWNASGIFTVTVS